MIEIVIVAILFAYAGWTIYKSVKKSKKGACASCSMNKSCSSGGCSSFQTTTAHNGRETRH